MLQLLLPELGPMKNPKYLPVLAIFMFFQSGILVCSQLLTAKMLVSEQTTEVKISTHLLGLRDRPETFRNILNNLAIGIRDCRLRSAAPKSSAQAKTFPKPGLTTVREKLQRRGSMPTLNKAPDKGHPCRTPEKTLNMRVSPPGLLV